MKGREWRSCCRAQGWGSIDLSRTVVGPCSRSQQHRKDVTAIEEFAQGRESRRKYLGFFLSSAFFFFFNMWLPLTWSPLGTWPTTQACALTGNWTSDPLVHSPSSIHWAMPARAHSFCLLMSYLPQAKAAGASWFRKSWKMQFIGVSPALTQSRRRRIDLGALAWLKSFHRPSPALRWTYRAY